MQEKKKFDYTVDRYKKVKAYNDEARRVLCSQVKRLQDWHDQWQKFDSRESGDSSQDVHAPPEELHFPAELTTSCRAELHDQAEMFGLHHFSIGHGVARHLVVTRVDPNGG